MHPGIFSRALHLAMMLIGFGGLGTAAYRASRKRAPCKTLGSPTVFVAVYGNARFPPNCDARGRDLLCPLHVDSGRGRATVDCRIFTASPLAPYAAKTKPLLNVVRCRPVPPSSGRKALYSIY